MRARFAMFYGFGLGVTLVISGCGSSNTGDPADESGGSGVGGSSAKGGGAGTSSSGGAVASGGAGGSSSSVGGGAGSGGVSTGGTTNQAGSGGTSTAGSGGMNTAEGCPTTQDPGTWEDVTPSEMSLPDAFHGPITVGVDPVRPNEIYVHVMEDGTWKSTDCGVSWVKVSTGQNGDIGGRPWMAAIDGNPNRDAETDPTLYKAEGYGVNGIWKSTNGGVDWVDVWNDNIYAEDGVTNIYADTGRDVSGAFLVDNSGPDHLIAYLHSYWGDQGNNGIFETTDGGGKWTVHKAETFNFQPHSDILFPIDATTWMVAHGSEIYRTTDSAQSWTTNDTDVASPNLARSYFKQGSTIYAGTDYSGNVYKSTDAGVSWTNLEAPGNQISWVAATETTLYVSNNRDEPHIFHAPIDDDTAWVDDGWPGMIHGGANTPGVLFDGSNYILIAASEQGGIWRFVEP